jgi:hypothetical protein
MIDLTVGNAIGAGVPLMGFIFLVYQNIQSNKEKHKVSVAADLEKQKATIEADAKKEEVKVLAEVEREKAKHQAEVDKIREQGMGGQAVAKIWQAMDNIKDDVRTLEENQSKDHADNLLRNEIVTRLHSEVSNFTKLLFENLIKRG